MKQRLFLYLFTIALFSNVINAQIEQNFRLNLRGSFGGNYSVAAYNFGVTANIGGYTEIPLSKKNNNCKINIGARINNKNYAVETNNVSLLFVDLPILFSYDFNLNTKNAIRLEVGPYYSQYIAGAVFSNGHNINNAFGYQGYFTACNVGLLTGGGMWHKDLYIGANFDFIWDWLGEDMHPAFYITTGYRF